MTKSITLFPVEKGERFSYLHDLLMADDSRTAVNSYINQGEMYLIECEQTKAGVVLFTFHDKQVVEIKNIALRSEFRGRGIGRLVIAEAFVIFKNRGFRKMLVGTANSSIGNLAFYQKVGFRMTAIEKGFFEQFPEPIFEDGIRALDLVMFEKDLTESEEIIRVLDENRNRLGVATRYEAHEKGLWHETFQCWFVSQGFIYFQIRSDEKKDYPSLLDITAAGHIMADETIEDGVREIEEELGISVTYEDLQLAGIVENSIITETIIDREFAHVFVYAANEPLNFKLQKEEVAGIVRAEWNDFERFCLGKLNEIKVSGYQIDDSRTEIMIEKYAAMQDFVPHPPGYWQQVAKAIGDILRS